MGNVTGTVATNNVRCSQHGLFFNRTVYDFGLGTPDYELQLQLEFSTRL